MARSTRSNVPASRWLHGPGPDKSLAQLLGSRRWLLADHQGSITCETDASGALIGTPYTYDPYGRPDAAHGFAGPRFRYTGQTALASAGRTPQRVRLEGSPLILQT